MASRIYPVSDWAAAQEAIIDEPESTVTTTNDALKQETVSSVHDTTKHRLRSMSHSLLGRRPPPESLLPTPDHDSLISQFDNLSVAASPHPSSSEQPPSHHGRSRSTAAGNGKVKGIIRRASMSLKGIVHHHHSKRHSVTHPGGLFDEQTSFSSAATALDSPAPNMHSLRPGTSHSHSTWHRLRQAASFRHARSSHGAELERPRFDDTFPSFPMPGSAGEPPIIPRNTGAAAKASAAAQNESLGLGSGRQMSPPPALKNKHWLGDFGDLSKNKSNDRESGIGITVTNVDGSEATEEVDVEGEPCLRQDTNISRVDFVGQMPVELSIQILANLDGAALNSAMQVSHSWSAVVRNQHVWRDAFMRFKAGTYATSGPVVPGAGQGVPAATPRVDWRSVYKAKEQLDEAWKQGITQAVYLNGHQDSIYCLQFDESKIITGSRDKTIRIWDMHTLKCRLVIGPPDVVDHATLLLDDDRMATHYVTRSDGERAEPSMPTCVSFPQFHDASILCLQYDDDILVTGSSDATCIVYSVKNGYRPIRRLRQHDAAVLDLAFDDRHIVTCSKDATICVWERRTGRLLRQLSGHQGPVNAVQLRANTIVSCSGDFRVKLWNVDTGKCIREFVGHTKGLACSQFSEDGRFVASAGNDKVIRIWDANTGECVRSIEAHESLVRSLHVDSVTGRLISGSYDTDIKVFDMATGRKLLDFPKWHASWVLSAKSDYRRIVSTGQDPKILIMDFGAQVDGVEVLESSSPLEAPA